MIRRRRSTSSYFPFDIREAPGTLREADVPEARSGALWPLVGLGIAVERLILPR